MPTKHARGGLKPGALMHADDRADTFLLDAVAYRYGEAVRASRIAESASDVDVRETGRLEENAAYHEMESLLHTVAVDCSASGFPLTLPPQLLERWSRVHAREMARTALIHHGALKALGALDRAGICAIPLKGFYLASATFERKGARTFKDLDLLVERSSLPALNDVLLAAGFTPAPGRPAFVPAPACTVYSLPVEGSETAMEIDIHVGMHWPEEYERRTAFRAEDLWAEAAPVELEGMPSWAMSPEHLVITTLLDAAVNHRYARLIKFRDVLEITRRHEVDWEALEGWCRRWKVCSFVGPGLRYLAEMNEGFSIPAGTLASVLPSYAAMKAFHHALPVQALPGHRSRSYTPANLLFFMLSDTPLARARGLAYMPLHMYKGRRRF